MEPKIYPIIAATSAITAIIGTDPVRFYPWGEAPANPEYPYVTYATDGAAPENYLDKPPDVDDIATSIDVWTKTGEQCLDLAKLIRDTLEPHAHMTGFGPSRRDPVTKSYTIRLQFDVFTFR